MKHKISSLTNLRSLELIDFNAHPNIYFNIVGVGAVGSKIFEQLLCLGCRNIRLFDYDVVEHHNLHNQIFVHEDIGKPKVEAALNWASRKYGLKPESFGIEAYNMKIDETTPLEGIVFSAVDSFEARGKLLDACVTSGAVALFIEGRCAPKFSEIRCVNPFNEEDVETFKESLGDDDNDDPYLSVCGLPISFSPTMSRCAITMVESCLNFLICGEVLPNQGQFRNIGMPFVSTVSQDLR